VFDSSRDSSARERVKVALLWSARSPIFWFVLERGELNFGLFPLDTHQP
jgi:hypothetical protein